MIHEYIWGTEDWLYQDNGLLIKKICANDNLSIQVHPNDEYAKSKGLSNGKTECWYITKASLGAYLYCGFIDGISPKQIKESLNDGSIEKYLRKVYVKRGDFIFIPAGMVHAICKGIELIEVQQDSTCTYRLYDYQRKDKDGNYRQLHLEDGLNALDLNADGGIKMLPFGCEYFNISLEGNKLLIQSPKVNLKYEV